MRALGYKAGIGTASRVMSIEGETTTLGVLVQSNFGGRLTIKGVNVARSSIYRTPRRKADAARL